MGIRVVHYTVPECGNVTGPAHGSAKLNSSRAGGVVIYECEPGFEIHGVDTRTCLNTGRWSGETPSCRKGQALCLLLFRAHLSISFCIFLNN